MKAPDPAAVGVVGHRALADVRSITSALEDVVVALDMVHPGRWRIISALAEGADRVVARRLLERDGSALVAVLPLLPEDYERDFDTEASRIEFRRLLGRAAEVVQLPEKPSREGAYEAAGQVVVERADVMVAVWDGEPARGRGGTAGVVEQARRAGLPIVWIHEGDRTPPTGGRRSLEADRARVTFERMHAPTPRRR
jgi:hypothetical protein